VRSGAAPIGRLGLSFRTTKKHGPGLSPVLAAVVLGLALAAGGCEKKSPGAFERPPAPVVVTAAVARDVPVYIDAVGKISAREVVTIQPQVSGRIVKIHFVDGADVKAGDILFTIDPRPFQAQLSAAEANLAQAQAALNLAKTNFERVQSVSDPRAVSRQDYDSKKNAVAVAEALVRQNRAAVESARLNLDYCTLRSPIDGRTGQRLVDVGNIVKENDTSLLVIQRLDPIYADFTVTEGDLSAVQDNMARRTLRVEVRLPDKPNKPRAGNLTFLDNSVEPGTGTVKLRATVSNRDHRFWPGRFVKVRLILAVHRDAILVPADAPQMSAKGPYVYVVKRDSTAELRPVTVGQRQGNLIVIGQGLKPGERVVVQGQLRVTPGGKVRIEPTAAADLSGARRTQDEL
jgi:multidrug efflux system membrane fusion protein